MSRVMARASVELMAERGYGELATIRTLPGLSVLRSIIGNGADLEETLRDAWPELRDGRYLLVRGTAKAPRYFAVEKTGAGIESTEFDPAILPQICEAIRGQDSTLIGREQRQHQSASAVESISRSSSVIGARQSQ